MEDIILDSTHISNDEHLMVKITNAFKKYDTTTVLNGFNMSVSKGVIYGLLGPSGCGKTTLLSSIIGRTRLNSGQIRLGVKRKKQIGYMPQDLALYDEFSMLETFHYFGSLYEMSYDEIIDKGEKLLNFMEMPPFTTQFGTMSGGQQRRFSLCVALLHDPSLLILDEPTVGVDPIISASIWTYLQDLTNRGKTIIITTHYIEEARQANMIGLMRKGVLLAEASPLDIMESCNADTLESAFLILSQKHSAHMSTERKISNTPQSSATTTLKKSSFFSKTRFKAQLLKHWYWSVRNWKIIGFVCILPIFTLLLFNTLIGQTPDPLNFGIINKEINKHTCQKIQLEEMCNDQIPLSCKYLYHLKNSEITLKYYDDEELAKSDALYNNIWGYLLFSNNFTNLINKRYNDSFGMSSEDFEHMTISSSIDMSDFITSKLIQSKLINGFEELSKAFNHCNSTSVRYIDPRPFKIMEPVFGKLKVNIVEYGTPAIISMLVNQNCFNTHIKKENNFNEIIKTYKLTVY
ncbi:ABC transporter G family member 23-like [Daktulosphaira vitifoliae]|uniref:ABC transporter G family member 23-like n=1 Tax=Daktulosphaira vitifoliae TaxID=58002 RepID=UPI0021AA0891|nr:ABC transporter G family member 23-like [Daktulosphaira vitifoliae]